MNKEEIETKSMLDLVCDQQTKIDWLNYCNNKQQEELKHLQNLIDKTTNYYLKTLAKNGSMPDEAVEMFNLLEGNK